MKTLALAGGVLCALAGVAQAAQAPEADAAAALRALFDEAWERDLREDPIAATYLGDRRYEREWPDMSLAAIARREASDRATLERLRGIDRARLSANDQLSYDLFARDYASRVAAQRFKPWLYDLATLDIVSTRTAQQLPDVAELLPFQTVADYENWVARIEGVGPLIDQYRALLEKGLTEKRTQPRIILERLGKPLARLAAGPAEESPFYAPFRRMPASISAPERERLQGAARRAIEASAQPAYGRLEAFLRARYLPAARASVGIWDTPDGADYYRDRVAFHTTTSLAPDDIHAIGLKEVARIRAEMDAIIAQVGFKGDFGQFLDHLRNDPQFYYRSADELFRAYVVIAKTIEPELVRLFGKLPRTPYGVRAIPSSSAPNQTTAYYQPPAQDGSRPGYYYVNLHRPEVRPKYEMEVLTVHEAVPGHHLQGALAMEQPDLPHFRRHLYITAYGEGWALYTESLGPELGLYKDPYSKFGQLTYDMWRAVRLVVDTGIHHKRWTREQAIEFFKANAAKTEADIVNEIDRYIAWPGQALAYKIGQLRIMALRREAESRLGDRFDIRDFHDVVLAGGSVPLEQLEGAVRRWIDEGGGARKD